jgi:hypothetical protein
MYCVGIVWTCHKPGGITGASASWESALRACPPSPPPLTYVGLPAYSALRARMLWIVGSTSNVQAADLARSAPAGRAFFAKKERPIGERGRRRR